MYFGMFVFEFQDSMIVRSWRDVMVGSFSRLSTSRLDEPVVVIVKNGGFKADVYL